MSDNIINATDESFTNEVLQATTPVLVDFWAKWCGPCKMLAPTLEAIAQEFAATIKVVKVDVDECNKTSADYNIRGIPALILFKEGKIVATKTGNLSKSQLIDFINANLS